LEGEIDVKLAAFGKLCSGFDVYSLKNDAVVSNNRVGHSWSRYKSLKKA
jgi:hypothetical protein